MEPFLLSIKSCHTCYKNGGPITFLKGIYIQISRSQKKSLNLLTWFYSFFPNLFDHIFAGLGSRALAAAYKPQI